MSIGFMLNFVLPVIFCLRWNYVSRQRRRHIRQWSCPSKTGLLKTLHSITNCDVQRYYQNVPKLKDVYSRNNLPNVRKNVAYIIVHDHY